MRIAIFLVASPIVLLFPKFVSAQDNAENPIAKWEAALANAESYSNDLERHEFLSTLACEQALKARSAFKERREKVSTLMSATFESLAFRRSDVEKLAGEFGGATGAYGIASENLGYWTALCSEYRRVSDEDGTKANVSPERQSDF